MMHEQRLIGFLENGFQNTKDYAKDTWQTYVVQPWKEGDPIAMATGTVQMIVSPVLEGPDQVWSDIVDQHLPRPHGIAGRIRRDIWELGKDVGTLHPLRALGDGWRLVTADPILDIIDAAGGHTRDALRAA